MEAWRLLGLAISVQPRLYSLECGECVDATHSTAHPGLPVEYTDNRPCSAKKKTVMGPNAEVVPVG